MTTSTRRLRLIFVALLLFCSSRPGQVDAAVLYQSGTLGQTGVTPSQLLDGDVLGTNVSSAVFVGARFELTNPAIVNEVGGHFASKGFEGRFFGAIVELTGQTDFPDSADLSTDDVLGVAVLSFPEPSNDVYGGLDLELDPGWYAIVFGSGLFGVTGDGGAVRNNVDVHSPDFIGIQTGAPWAPRTEIASGQRLVVTGRFVPEPQSYLLLLLCIGFMGRRKSQGPACGYSVGGTDSRPEMTS